MQDNKQYYIDKNIKLCYPYETFVRVDDYGVLKDVVGIDMSRDDIDKIIAHMILSHPYVSGAMSLKINVMWKIGNMIGYYHMLEFENDDHENQTKHSLTKIRYEKKLNKDI